MSNIKYRSVVNDAVVGEWEDMPEVKGETIVELSAYINTCPGWSSKHLKRGAWDTKIINHESRHQFLLPVIPTDEDFELVRNIKDKSQKGWITGGCENDQ